MHDVPLPYGDPLLATLAALPPAVPAVALMRHSIRGPVTDLRTAPDVLLTSEGARAARRLGERLGAARPVRLVHSPIRRCAQTAESIAEGLSAIGGRVHLDGERPALGAPYVLDFERLVEAAGQYDPLSFVRAWFGGRLSPGIVAEARAAARGLLDTALDELARTPSGSLGLLVSHDWNVLLVRELYLGVRHEEVGWLDYLDGVVLVATEGGLELRWRGHVHRLEEVPA